MRILGIDSSALVASVAFLEDDTILGEYTTNHKKTHSETLMPMLEALAAQLELDLSTLDAIAVAAGPGSFTGLRIGCATAKGLALALDKPVVSVKTVDAMACALFHHKDLICPMMDARRNQTYTGIYRWNGEVPEALRPQCAIAVEELIADLNARGEAVTFLGDGVPVFSEMLKEKLTVPYTFAPAHLNRQRGACVAYLGGVLFRKGACIPGTELKIDYLRLSQAERERRAKGLEI